MSAARKNAAPSPRGSNCSGRENEDSCGNHRAAIFPRPRRLALRQMPARKFNQRLPVIPLRINRRAAIRGQVGEKFFNPLVADFRRRIWFGFVQGSARHVRRNLPEVCGGSIFTGSMSGRASSCNKSASFAARDFKVAADGGSRSGMNCSRQLPPPPVSTGNAKCLECQRNSCPLPASSRAGHRSEQRVAAATMHPIIFAVALHQIADAIAQERHDFIRQRRHHELTDPFFVRVDDFVKNIFVVLLENQGLKRKGPGVRLRTKRVREESGAPATEHAGACNHLSGHATRRTGSAQQAGKGRIAEPSSSGSAWCKGSRIAL